MIQVKETDLRLDCPLALPQREGNRSKTYLNTN